MSANLLSGWRMMVMAADVELHCEIAALRQRIAELEAEIIRRDQAQGVQASESNEYRTLFDRMRDPCAVGQLIFDDKGKPIDSQLVAVNPAFEAEFGVPAKAIVNKSVSVLFPGTVESWLEAIEPVVRLGHPLTFERFAIRVQRYFDVLVYRVRENRYAAILRDITDRKETEANLAREKERLGVTLRSIADGVIATDTAGRILVINRVAEALTGWLERDAVGKPLYEVYRVADAQSEIEKRGLIERLISSNEPARIDTETLLVSRDGTERTVADSRTPIRDERNLVVGMVVVFRDVTAKALVEAEMLKAQKLESLSIVAGGIAHDFNNMLAAVLGNISLARTQAKNWPHLDERLADAERATMLARGLTKQLLTFSKTTEPLMRATDMACLLREVVDLAICGTNVVCRFDIPNKLWLVVADQGQLAQVIHNLVINAVQAMPRGGTIVIGAENVTITQGNALALKPGPYIRFFLRDEGTGIPEELRQKIFYPYFSTKASGSGLGLATTCSILTHHDGHIAVESEVDVGTTFFVHLPAAPAACADHESTAFVETTGQGRILVMDDEPMVRTMTAAILRHGGYEVDSVANGDEAMQAYSAARKSDFPYSAVIMDLTVPGGMGGKEAIVELRKMDPDVKAIVSSGYANDPIMGTYREHGFQAALVKPYCVSDLLRALRSVLPSIPSNDCVT